MTRLSCVEFVELVTGHIEMALDRETERRFAEHITECDGCERYMDQYCQTMRLLGQLRAEVDEVPTEKVSADALERLVSAFWSWRRS
jgi:predicted anti-sigma-YlaC factor YlaD